MKRLLFLVHRIPYPPNKGDKVRSFNELKYLTKRYRVYVGAFVDDDADFEYEAALRELCEDCHLVPLNPVLARIKSLAGFFTGEPLTLPYYSSTSMRTWVRNLLHTKSIDSILVFSAAMAQYVMPARDIRRVADLVDVDSDKWRQYASTKSWPYSTIYTRESRKLLDYETRIASEFDATVFVSTPEAELFRRLVPCVANKVFGISNGVDCDYFSPGRTYRNPYNKGDRVLVFTGAMDYWPNVDAVVTFAHEVFPGIRAQDTSARFYIVGARPAQDVKRLAELPGVMVTGAVTDIRPYIAHAKLAVAPLRLARGIQNKVLEAMAMARTVIASPQAAEGIEAHVGREIFVVEGEDWVRQVLQLLRQDGAVEIGVAGRTRVLASYSWESNLSRFEQMLTSDRKSAGVDQAVSAPVSRTVHSSLTL